VPGWYSHLSTLRLLFQAVSISMKTACRTCRIARNTEIVREGGRSHADTDRSAKRPVKSTKYETMWTMSVEYIPLAGIATLLV
jgi:hypothetical protein